MTIPDMLAQVLAEHAEQRPDADTVLAEVRQRVNRRHRVVITRATAALGSAAAMAAVAVGVATLADRPSGHAPVQAGALAHTPRATPSTLPNAISSATARHPSRSGPSSSPGLARARLRSVLNYSTIAAGWLPGPGQQVEADNQPGFEERDYDVTVDGVDMDVIIWTEDGQLPSSTEAGSNYRSITINGHPAREFIAGVATIVAVDLGNGTIAYAGPSVTATTQQVTTERISTIALHVASSMQFGRHDPIPGN